MAKKKDVIRYRCMNFGVCAKADANEIIEIPAIDTLGGTPSCPCCKQNTLQELPPSDPFWPKIAAIVVGGLVVLGGGGYGVYSLMKSPTPESIVLNHTEKTLMVGDMDTLRATISPDGCEGTFTWKAGKEGTLTVSNDGIVTAVKEGTGKVRVILEGADGIKAVCEYTIKEKEEGPKEGGDTNVEGLQAEVASAVLKLGETQQLKVNVVPATSTATIAWQTSDASVVTVSPTGLLTAVKAGKATVTATAGGKSCTVNVTVAADKVNNGGQKTAVKNGVGRVNLGYGSYYGELKNGAPHGHGTITYSKSTRIVNSKDFYAQRGDKYEGEFRNGKVAGGIGYWHHNGDITTVIP